MVFILVAIMCLLAALFVHPVFLFVGLVLVGIDVYRIHRR